MHGGATPIQGGTPNSSQQLQTTQPTSQQPQQTQAQQQVNPSNLFLICNNNWNLSIIQHQQPPQQSHDPKHVNPANPIPFHLYATTTKREYTDLHTNTTQAAANPVTVDGKQSQMSQWGGYEANKVE